MLQRIIEQINQHALTLLRDSTLKKPLAYVEVLGIGKIEVDGGEANITILLRNHFKEASPQQTPTYNETKTIFSMDIDGDEDGDGELTVEEVHHICGQFLAVLRQKPFTVNLVTGKSCGLSQLPAQTPCVAYVGNVNVTVMGKIYAGTPKIDMSDSGIIQHLTDTYMGYSHNDKSKMPKVIEAVALKGGKVHMQTNNFTPVSTTPIPFWRKHTKLGDVNVRIYVSPFIAGAVDTTGQVHFIYDKLKFTLESNYSIVSRLKLPAEDKQALLTLLEMTDLRKKAPKI